MPQWVRKMNTYYPQVAVAVTSFKNSPYLRSSLESLLSLTEYPKFDVYIIDYGTEEISSLVKELQMKYGNHICLIEMSMDFGITGMRNLAFETCARTGAKYFVIMDDDIIITDIDWLNKLVHLMERLPQDVVAATPQAGWLLYPNCTAYGLKETETPRRTVWPALCTGGQIFIVRESLVREFYKCGLKPYCDLFFIQSEDIDFALKIYLRGYKAVCTNVTEVLHARNRNQLPLYRIYHSYKSRVLLLLLNFSFLHLVRYVPFRLLHDFIHAVVVYPMTARKPAAEAFVLLVKAYVWILRRLKSIFKFRSRIQICWRRADDSYVKKILLPVQLPLHLDDRSPGFLSQENKRFLYTSFQKYQNERVLRRRFG